MPRKTKKKKLETAFKPVVSRSFPVIPKHEPPVLEREKAVKDTANMYECPICGTTWLKSEGEKCKVCEEKGQETKGVPFTKT